MGSYGRLSTAFYDADKPFAPADAVDFYRARAVRSVGPVLEPMCGSGRFLLPLLEAGVPIEGVDGSADMLAACRSRAERLGLAPTLYQQSLEELALPKLYGLAFIPSGSLGLIHRRSSLGSSLRGLRRHLNPDASLLIELVDADSPESDTNGSGSRSVDLAGNRSITYAWRTTFHRGDRTVHFDSHYQLREADTVLAEESEELALGLYTSREILDELHRAGFTNAHRLPTTDETSWLRESGCSLFECKVPGNPPT
jgi:SAM-dependent methyltransferase